MGEVKRNVSNLIDDQISILENHRLATPADSHKLLSTPGRRPREHFTSLTLEQQLGQRPARTHAPRRTHSPQPQCRPEEEARS